jgi:adenosine deaminase CECR1
MSSDLAEYQERRAALISDDRSYRRDLQATISSAEVKAEQVVRDIRALEASTIWKQEHASVPHPFPGMEFLTGTIHFSRAERHI